MWNYFSRKTVMDHDSSQSRQYYQTYLQVATQKKKSENHQQQKFVVRYPSPFFKCRLIYEKRPRRRPLALQKKLIKRESKLPLLTP